MERRTTEAYAEVIRYFKDRVAPTFLPDVVICDYERALQNAFHTIYPNAEVKGCYFHYAQVSNHDIKDN